MASFPSGVVVATTVDRHREPRGFTASAFCSVSADPPLVLVCLSKDAECHPAFAATSRWAISVLHNEQHDVAMLFATRGADKFASRQFSVNAHGIPVADDAVVQLDCEAHATYDAGDHTVLIARVEAVTLGSRTPMVYYRRRFLGVGG